MRSSFSGGTPDSSVSEGDGSFRLHDRKPSAPARTMTPGGNYSDNSYWHKSWLVCPQVEVLAADHQAAMRNRNMDQCNLSTVVVWLSFKNENFWNPSWPSFPTTFADGSTHKTSTSSVRRTPSFQRSTLNRPGSSNTLPRKGSAAQSTESPGATSSGTRNRNPSGSSASGMSSSPSVGLNGSSSANR